ncbi:unnamed protein product [Mycena citricolor]|uniref:Guanine nucleotide-binding protein-like 1 n=1 Tax=Mycena citricolor TaxID=2018698 RepID=A0AAD2GWS9_9AGAR|nr:unnamed protein product [Mycena citricolor]
MPRRRPTSQTAKKASIKLKRAVKRGDLPAPDKQPSVNRTQRRATVTPASDAIQSSRKLQSAFVKLPDHFLEQTKTLAAQLPLTRPILVESCVLSVPPSSVGPDTLSCPRRPKWRFDMSKKEVERNEEGLFRKWLAQTDDLVQRWQDSQIKEQPVVDTEIPEITEEPTEMPPSTTYFERNLEVWRQLYVIVQYHYSVLMYEGRWRVTEISQIILVLIDSRAPLLHYPPSLDTYLSNRRVILVLTKVDISGSERVNGWIRYFNEQYPRLRVVQVRSYAEKEISARHQGRRQHEPHIPQSFRAQLVDAIRQEHSAMLDPPETVKAKPERLEAWKPSVKREIDWDRVLSAEGDQVGTQVGGAAAPRGDTDEEEPHFLTIGLIGQPNVGKSSLLNALFGAHKVRASKTPGKTKHFQTLFWTPDVRLVDCPGLVMPNFVRMETQVFSGILPISRVSAVPACIFHAAELIPLEQAYKLSPPEQPSVVDNRTWRDGERPNSGQIKEKQWTAMDILTSYANLKGWVTAKGGRPDVHRAGNAILRALAEGRVPWAFWPPGASHPQNDGGSGIWIPSGSEEEDSEDDEESQEEESERESDAGTGSEGGIQTEPEESTEEQSDEDQPLSKPGGGRFGALQITEEGEEESGEED